MELQQSVDGWLDSTLDTIDFFECAQASSLEWHNVDNVLALSQYDATGNFLTATAVGGTVMLEANAAYFSIGIDEKKTHGALLYTLTLA